MWVMNLKEYVVEQIVDRAALIQFPKDFDNDHDKKVIKILMEDSDVLKAMVKHYDDTLTLQDHYFDECYVPTHTKLSNFTFIRECTSCGDADEREEIQNAIIKNCIENWPKFKGGNPEESEN